VFEQHPLRNVRCESDPRIIVFTAVVFPTVPASRWARATVRTIARIPPLVSPTIPMPERSFITPNLLTLHHESLPLVYSTRQTGKYLCVSTRWTFECDALQPSLTVTRPTDRESGYPNSDTCNPRK